MSKEIPNRVMAETKMLAIAAIQFVQKDQAIKQTSQDFGRFASNVLDHLEAAVQAIRSGETPETGHANEK